ncbi:MAG: flavin reductase family protein, partial [Candidatus Omnitrophica bacterium]|nr:flavin reductase family protein [Candidatus Omnitrophota bacterium]
VPLSKVNRLINSGNLILVTSHYQGKSNIITLAWHMPISLKPPIIGIAVAKSHFSAELILKSKEFIVNIPDWSLLDKVIYCGKHSGKDIDKFKETGFTPQRAKKLSTVPKISECIGSIECCLREYKEIGDHFLFLGEALYAEAEEEFFKNDIWDTKRCALIYHLGANFFMKSAEFLQK